MDNVAEFALGDVVTTKDDMAEYQLGRGHDRWPSSPEAMTVVNILSDKRGFQYTVSRWVECANDTDRQDFTMSAFELVAYPTVEPKAE